MAQIPDDSDEPVGRNTNEYSNFIFKCSPQIEQKMISSRMEKQSKPKYLPGRIRTQAGDRSQRERGESPLFATKKLILLQFFDDVVR